VKILLLLGILIYFVSRWILDQGKKSNGRKKIFFSHILVLAEIATVFAVVTQLLWDIVKWDLSLMIRWVGLILFIGGVFLSVYSRVVLGGVYSTARNFSKPKQLVQHGPYRYIRHPIYSGTILMGLGFELAISSYLFFVVLIFGTAVVYFCAEKEEKMLENCFWEYRDYQKRTKRFIPFVF